MAEAAADIDQDQEGQTPPQQPPASSLPPEQKTKLDGIVVHMYQQKASKDEIQSVVDDFKRKYTSTSSETTPDASSYSGFGSRALEAPGTDQARADQRQRAADAIPNINNAFNSKETTAALNKMQQDEFQKTLNQTNLHSTSEAQPVPRPDIKLLPSVATENSEALKEVVDPNSYTGRSVLKHVLNTTKDEKFKNDLGANLSALDHQNKDPNIASAVYNKIKSGQFGYDPVAQRPTVKMNPAEAFIDGLEKTYQAKEKADFLASASPEEIAQNAERERVSAKNDFSTPIAEASGWNIPFTNISTSKIANTVGENITGFAKAGVAAGVAATGVGALEMAAAPGLTADITAPLLKPTLGALFIAHDAGKQAAGQAFDQEYNQQRDAGLDPQTAAEKALHTAKVVGATTAAQMAVMAGAGLKLGEHPLPGTVWNKGFTQIIKSHAQNIVPFLKRLVPEAGVQGSIAGATKGLQNLDAGKPVLDGTGDAAMGAATFVSLLSGLGAGLHALTPRGELVAMDGISKMNPDLVERGINQAVDQKHLTEQQAQDFRDKLNEQRSLNKNLPPDAPLENRGKIQTLITKRNALENQLDPDHPSFVDKAFHPDIKEEINGVKKVKADGTSEGKDGINEKIRQLSEGESPNFHEDEKLVNTPLDQAKALIAERAVDGRIGKYDTSNPQELLKNIAEQAHGGTMLDGKFISSRPIAEETFGKELVDLATKAHPEHVIPEQNNVHQPIGIRASSNIEDGIKKQEVGTDAEGKPIVNEVEYTKDDADVELDRLESFASKGKLTLKGFLNTYFGQSTITNEIDHVRSAIESDPVKFIKNLRETFEGGHELKLSGGKMQIEHEPDLRTLDYGDWKGKPESKESQEKIKQEILNNEPIGVTGERLMDAANRAIPAAKKIMDNPDENTTIVTHSSVIKMMKAWEEIGRPEKIDESNFKEFAKNYIEQKPEPEGHINSFKSDQNGTTTHIIRHGETEDNKLSEFREDNTALTPKGERQAAASGKALFEKTGGDIPRINTSDLPRTVATSGIIAKDFDGGKIEKPHHTVSRDDESLTNVKLKDNATAIHSDQGQPNGEGSISGGRENVSGENIQQPTGKEAEPADTEQQDGSGKPPTEEKEAVNTSDNEGEITSIRNSVTEEKIKAAGLNQPITEGVRTFGDVWEEAKAKVADGYDTNHLIHDLEKNPNRPLSDLEDALLTYHNAVKEAELFDINKKINEASEKGNPNEVEALASDKAKVLDDLQHIYNIDKQAGAANARGLNARKLMVDRKYSLAAMIAEKRATENFGEPLDKDQQAEVEKQFKDIKDKYDALQEHTKKLEAENARLKADKAFEKVKKEKSSTKTSKTKEDYAAERKALIEKYKASKGGDTTKRQGAFISDEDVKLVAKLLKSYVEEGVDNLKEAVTKIHDIVKDHIEGITDKDIHNIIAGQYATKPTRSEMGRKISDLKSEAALVNKIESLQKEPKPKSSKDKIIQNKKLYDLRQQIKELKDTPAAKTEAAKERIKKQIADINEKIKNKDFSPPEKKAVPVLDKEGFRLKAEYEKAKDVFDQDMKRNELKNSTPFKKGLRLWVRGERAFKLSNPITIGKLAAAAATRMATAIPEEGVGAFWSQILPKSITSKATGEAGFHVKALAKGYTEAFMQGIKEAGETARGIKTSLEANLGKKGQLPPEALDFFGQLHSALKAPVKRFAFERSFKKRMINNAKNGVNVDDPMVQARISVEAYQDANRAIFMQDNWVSKGWTTAVRSLENSNNRGANFGAAVAQWLLPFVKVPTNIVAETAEHTFGFTKAAVKIISVMAQEGLKNISQEDAEAIMRNLKKGSIGAAAMTLGFLNPQAFGGYYQDREKRNPSDVRYGETRVYGVNVPAWMQEAPIFQAMQFGSTIRRLADGYMGKKPMGLGDAALGASFGLIAHEPLWDEPARLIQLKDPNERKWVVGELAKSTIVPSLIDYSAKVSDPADQRPLWERFLDPVNQRKPTNADWPSSIKEHIEGGLPILNQNLDLKSNASGKGDRK